MTAGVLAVGFALGAWFGGWLVTTGRIPERALRHLFVFFMLYVAGSMLFRSDRRVWAAAKTIAPVVGVALA